MHKNLAAVAASFLSLVFLIVPSQADPLPSFWQKQRDAGNALTDRACKGEARAINQVWAEIKAGNPVMLNNMSFLRAKCGPFRPVSERKAAEYQLKAANMGYPIALTGYANRLLGNYDDGVPKDPARGVAMLERAVKGGYGIAASDLAWHYSNGKVLRRDLAKASAYLAIAKREGVSARLLAKPEKLLAKALSKDRAKGNNTAGNTQPAPADSKFAALVVSTSDGGYGFAHDHPDQASAQKRALNECRKRGGRDCDVKMVGYGKGCMAYRYADGSSTVYGWSMGNYRPAVESRAARECRKRNGNKACRGYAWVCNDRTNAAFKVVLQKPIPDGKIFSGEGAMCNFAVRWQCAIKGNKLSTYFAYENAVSRKPRMKMPGFATCRDVAKSGKIIYGEVDGKPIVGLASVYEPNKKRIHSLMAKLKKAVLAKFPGCTNRIRNRKYPNRVNVVIGSITKTSTLRSKDAGKNNHRGNKRDDGSQEYYWFHLE